MKTPVINKWVVNDLGTVPNQKQFAPFHGRNDLTRDDSEFGYRYRFRFMLSTETLISHEAITQSHEGAVIHYLIKDANRNLLEVVYGDMRKKLIGIMFELGRLYPSEEVMEIRQAVDKLIRYTDGEEVDL